MEARFAEVPDEVWERVAPLLPQGPGEPPMVGVVHGKPRRWVVERTGAWLNRFRCLLVRWERRAENFLGLLHLGCALIAYQQAL
jgi:hypothetical protein